MSATADPATVDLDREQGEVSPDEGFDLLSNHRRRYAMHHLQHRRRPAELGELAEQIAAWENGISVGEVSAAERKRVYTSLQQVHLPRMDELGVVEFDDRAGTVELGPAAEELDVYMEVVQGNDVPWSQFYLGLAGVNVLLLAFVVVGAWPFRLLPDIAWAAFAVTTFLLSAAVHTYYNRTEMQLQATDRPPELEE